MAVPSLTPGWRRALWFVGRGLGGLMALILALVLAVALLSDLSVMRRVAARRINDVLAGEFKGRLTVENVGALHLSGVRGVDFRVEAPDGTTVIAARGVRGRIAPVAFLLALLGRGEMQFDVLDIDADAVDVNLDADESGVLKLQTAFEPAQRPSSRKGSPSRALHLEFPRFTSRHVRLRGQMKGAPPLDADLDALVGSVQVLPDTARVDVVRVDATTRAMPGGANAHGVLQAHLEIPLAPGKDMVGSGSFTGDIGGIPATAKAGMRGDWFDAVVDVPEVASDKIRALAAQAPIYQSAAVHVEAHGPLVRLGVIAYATIGTGQVEVHGTVSLAGRLGGAVSIDLRTLDLRALVLGAPISSVALHADVRAGTNTEGLLDGGFGFQVPEGGEIAGQSVPAASFLGQFEQRPGNAGFLASARGNVSEPGAPMAVRMEARIGSQAPAVHFVATSHLDHLADVRRVGGLGPGSANVRVAGAVTLSASPSFDAVLDADAVGLAHGPFRIERAELSARGFGPLSAPTVGGALDLSRGGANLHASIDLLPEEGGGLDSVGVSISGLGEPVHAALHYRPHGVAVHGDSTGLELKTLGYLLGIDDMLRKGRLIFSVDLAARSGGAEGTATVDLADVCLGNTDGLSAHAEASIRGRKVTGSITASAAGIGTVKVTALDLEVGGKGPLELASVRRTWGSLQVEGQADLAKLLDLLPPNVLPIARASGQMALQGHVERDTESDTTPDIALTLKTSGLVVALQSAPEERRDPALSHPRAEQVAGLDLKIDATANGTTGFSTLAVGLIDTEGSLASLEAKSASVPYGLLLASGKGVATRMMNTPFTARITIPSRNVAKLPEFMGVGGASGEVEGSIAIEGTCLEPKVNAQLTANSVKFDASQITPPFDVRATAKYDGTRADMTLDVGSSAGQLMQAAARVNAKISDLVAPSGQPSWDASAKAAFMHFPLESVGPLADRRLHGVVTGRFELSDLHKDPRASADFDIETLRVRKAKYGHGKVTIGFDGHSLDAKLRVEETGGFAAAALKIGVLWGRNVTPSVDPAGSLEASLQTKHFRAVFLAPFVEAAMDEIDGTIDADAHFSSSGGEKPEMKGSVELKDGLVNLIAIGQELHSVNAKVTLTPDGVLRLEHLSAQGIAGKIMASGEAHLDGTTLVGASAVLNIAKREAMLLNVQGSEVGRVYGQASLKATMSGDHKTMTLNVDVPSLHVELPEASTHAVQDLGEPPPEVHVGVYASTGRFLVLPIDGATAAAHVATPKAGGGVLKIVAHLGQDVEVRRGTDLKVTLEGTATAQIEQATQVTGQIRLLAGKLDVQGKSFDIESGTVTFVGDPGNPMISVTAGWTAEDGTHVYADYLGPLKTGKVTLRSEPARPQNEIVALILFGTADGSQATPYATTQPDVGAKAGTAVGGFASAGLSKGLDKLTGMEITAKIDSSQANPRPEVEVQVAKDISLQLAYVLGQPPPGTNLDTLYATIDWRFLRSWSLETTFGNLGSSIADVVWQHRY